MGVFDSAVQWFNQSEKQTKQQNNVRALSGVEMTEEDFNDILRQMERDEQDRLKTERKKYIDSFMPQEPELDYRHYEMKSDKTLYDKAVADNKDSYLLDERDVQNKYDQDIDKANMNSEKAKASSRADGEKVKEQGIDTMEAFKQRALNNNLVNSSIMTDGKNKIIQNSKAGIRDIQSRLDMALEQVEKQKAQAGIDKENSEQKIQQDYQQKVNKQVEKDKKAEQSKKDRVDKYNSDLDEKKAKYEENVQRITVERGREYDEQLDRQQKYEDRFGYSGVRKAEYDERLRIAKQFYRQFPKEQAVDMIMHNRELPALLGYYYEILARDISNA